MQQHHNLSNFTGEDNWVILSDIGQSIKRKIEAAGTPLKEWDINIYRGILTGFNDAFVISTEKRDEILASCKTDDERERSASIIRPILRGRDIKRYSHEWANLWLVWIPWHFPLHLDPTIQGASEVAENEFKKQYPAVYKHLLHYKTELSARNKAETGIRYEWYAMQRWGANYWDEFSKPKIIYPNMTKFLPFVYDEKGYITNQKCFIITGKHLAFLTAFLNSSLFKFCFADRFPELQGKTRELSKIFIDEIPVPQISDSENEEYSKLVNHIQSSYSQEQAIAIDQMIFDMYGLTPDEQAFIGFVDFGEK